MSKYIPAEKLIAEIERLDEKYRLIRVGKNIQQAREADLVIRILLGLSNFIDSLQQEQPFPRWIHANYSDKPEIRQSPSGGPYLQSGPYMIWLSDLETLPKDGTDLTNPIQEQLEMELNEEIDKEWAKCQPVDEGMGLESANIVIEQFNSIVSHFYELGRLNARKEE